jgi:hypothetical protein
MHDDHPASCRSVLIEPHWNLGFDTIWQDAACCSVLVELHWNLGFDTILQDAALIQTSMSGMSSHNYSLYSSYTYIIVCTLH